MEAFQIWQSLFAVHQFPLPRQEGVGLAQEHDLTHLSTSTDAPRRQVAHQEHEGGFSHREIRGERGCVRWRICICCRTSRISICLTMLDRRPSQTTSSSNEQTCARSKKIMTASGAWSRPCGAVESKTE